jgi:hypothetical protein
VVTALGTVPAGAVQLPLRQRTDLADLPRPTAAGHTAPDGLLTGLLELTALLRPAQAVTS